MTDRDYGFDDRPRGGIMPYVVWTTVACLAVGAFLYADGYFDEIIDEVTEVVTDAPKDG